MAPSPGTDWTEDERAHIGRLETLCRSTDHWEMECSFTDAGDPWCVIYDLQEHRILRNPPLRAALQKSVSL